MHATYIMYFPNTVFRLFIIALIDVVIRGCTVVVQGPAQEGLSVQVRPIVANHNGPSYKLSWLLSKLLTPFLKTIPAHLENSMELIHCIRDISRTTTSHFPCSLDVSSMYTSIPTAEAVNNALSVLEMNSIYKLKGLSLLHLNDLLRVIIDNTFFTFSNKIFKQIMGLPMGSSLSGILAILFMDTLERRALFTLPNLPLFKRYVDDCFLLAKDRDEALLILDTFNSQHPNINFEIEFPQDGRTLSLLDFTVTMRSNDDPKFEFFRKKARKDLFVHYSSHIPFQSKINYIRNERLRIRERCSESHSFAVHNNNFERILEANGYPKNVIERSKTPRTDRTSRRTRTQCKADIFYLKMDFFSNSVSRRIKSVFAREGLNIRLVHNTISLRNALNSRQNSANCSLLRCPLQNQKLCFQRYVIYKAQCHRCQQLYIGSTIRPLHLRAKEHLENSRSSVFRHRSVCNSSFSFEVMGRARDEANLRLKEAILIRQQNPAINSKAECDELKDFVFF